MIPWETSSKINRYVYLCQDYSHDDDYNDDWNNRTLTSTFLPVESPSISLAEKAHPITATTAQSHVSTIATATTTSTVSTYQYRDAPTTFHRSNNKNNNNERSLPEQDAPDFPSIVRKIGQQAEEWYYNNIQQQQQQDVSDDYNERNIEQTERIHFNVCLLNYYQNGLQRIGFHSDREEIGRTTPVISISFGTPRTFYLRAKSNAMYDRTTLILQSGSLLCMKNACQQFYVHAIPKENHITTGRINLTFRCKAMDTIGERLHARQNHWLYDMMTEQQESHDANDPTYSNNTSEVNHDLLAAASQPLQKYTNPISTQGWSLSSSMRQHQQKPNNGKYNNVLSNDEDNIAIIYRPHVFGDDVLVENSTVPIEKSTIQYLIKTNLGAECYSAAEVMELFCQYDNSNSGREEEHFPSLMQIFTILARPCNLDGYVGIIRKDDDGSSHVVTIDKLESICDKVTQLLVANMRSAHHVLKYHDHFQITDCRPKNDSTSDASTAITTSIKDIDGEMIYQYCKDRLVANSLTVSTLTSRHHHQNRDQLSFRVSCERIGTGHNFRGPDIEREIGGALSEYYHEHCIPSMEDYDVNIRADVIGPMIVIGTQLNVHDLSKERHFLRYRNAVTLKVFYDIF